MPLLAEYTVLKISSHCPEKQSLPWNFPLYLIHFLPFRIFEHLALALKTEFALKIFTVLSILLHSGFLSNFLLPWKTELPWTFSFILKYFLSFRIFEQLALALKTEFALNSMYWVYIFYHSGFLSNLRLPWKHELPWNFSLYWNITYLSGILSNFRWPWKQTLPWNFSRQGIGRPSPPPRVVCLCLCENPDGSACASFCESDRYRFCKNFYKRRPIVVGLPAQQTSAAIKIFHSGFEPARKIQLRLFILAIGRNDDVACSDQKFAIESGFCLDEDDLDDRMKIFHSLINKSENKCKT